MNGVHASDLEELAVGSDDRPLLMTADSPAEPVKRDIAFRLTALRDNQNYNIAGGPGRGVYRSVY